MLASFYLYRRDNILFAVKKTPFYLQRSIVLQLQCFWIADSLVVANIIQKGTSSPSGEKGEEDFSWFSGTDLLSTLCSIQNEYCTTGRRRLDADGLNPTCYVIIRRSGIEVFIGPPEHGILNTQNYHNTVSSIFLNSEFR